MSGSYDCWTMAQPISIRSSMLIQHRHKSDILKIIDGISILRCAFVRLIRYFIWAIFSILRHPSYPDCKIRAMPNNVA